MSLDRPTKGRGIVAGLLAMVAGYVDAYAVLSYGVYASFMSGNTTQTGLMVGQFNWLVAARDFLPIPFFVLGVFAGTLIGESGSGRRPPWRLLLVTVMGLLALAIAVTALEPIDEVSIALASVAMGIMNTTITRLGGQPVSLGYVTGSLNNVGRSLALSWKRAPVPNAEGPQDTHLRRAAVLASLWLSFLVGAMLGSAATFRLQIWTLLPPIFLMLVIAGLQGGQPPRAPNDHSA